MVKGHSYRERERGTRCPHIGYSFRLAARVLLYASSHRRDNTYHSLRYTSRGILAGTRNRSMGSPWRIDPTTHRAMSERSYHGATSRSKLWQRRSVLCATLIIYRMTDNPIRALRYIIMCVLYVSYMCVIYDIYVLSCMRTGAVVFSR